LFVLHVLQGFGEGFQGTFPILVHEQFDAPVVGHFLIGGPTGVVLVFFQKFHGPLKILGCDIGIHQEFLDLHLICILGILLKIAHKYHGYRFVGIADLIAQTGIVQQGILLDLGTEIHLGCISKGIQGLGLTVQFQIAFRQMVIGILGHPVVAPYDLVELLDRLLVIPHFVMAVAQQIEIGIAELPALALVLLQIRNGLPVTPQVEIAFPDDLVEFGDLSPIGSGQLVFGHFNGLFKVPQFEVQICLVIGKFLVEQLGIGDLIKTGAGLVVVILFIGNVPQVVFGLGTIFFGV